MTPQQRKRLEELRRERKKQRLKSVLFGIGVGIICVLAFFAGITVVTHILGGKLEGNIQEDYEIGARLEKEDFIKAIGRALTYKSSCFKFEDSYKTYIRLVNDQYLCDYNIDKTGKELLYYLVEEDNKVRSDNYVLNYYRKRFDDMQNQSSKNFDYKYISKFKITDETLYNIEDGYVYQAIRGNMDIYTCSICVIKVNEDTGTITSIEVID